MSPSQTHKFIALIPINIDDLSGLVPDEELYNVVYQEIVNNIEQHKDQIVIMRNEDELSEETE